MDIYLLVQRRAELYVNGISSVDIWYQIPKKWKNLNFNLKMKPDENFGAHKQLDSSSGPHSCILHFMPSFHLIIVEIF